GGRGQRGGRDGERAERRPPQVPDDGGVGQVVGRLGGDRPERGQRERRDTPVQLQVGPGSQHGPPFVGRSGSLLEIIQRPPAVRRGRRQARSAACPGARQGGDG